jgi:hypothetical protein
MIKFPSQSTGIKCTPIVHEINPEGIKVPFEMFPI